MSFVLPLPIPVLVTDRLTLREPRETDFAAMLAFNASPRSGFVGGGVERKWVWRGLLANIGHWALRGYGFFSVETRAGDFVGRVGVIYHDGWDEPELAWHLYDGFEGQGYAQEAALAARADYHARISPQPLISYVDVANARSEALALRLGAIRETTVADAEGDYHVYRHPAASAMSQRGN
jgi:RimJ/RimL family protein N-acetyltransferase